MRRLHARLEDLERRAETVPATRDHADLARLAEELGLELEPDVAEILSSGDAHRLLANPAACRAATRLVSLLSNEEATGEHPATAG